MEPVDVESWDGAAVIATHRLHYQHGMLLAAGDLVVIDGSPYGFAGIDAGASVAGLVYVRLSGNEPAGEERPVDLAEKDDVLTPDEAAGKARAELEELVRRFDAPDTPYRSLVLPMWQDRYGEYDHLARVKEWSDSGGATGGEAQS